MDITIVIKTFSAFLNNSWNNVAPLLSDRPYTTDESSKSDWLQANWELLVERKILPLNQYLEVYGEGADFNGVSSRITDVHSPATHKIMVIARKERDLLNNIKLENSMYPFERLVGFKNGFYTDTPPFDFVLVRDEDIDTERVFSWEKVEFEVQQI